MGPAFYFFLVKSVITQSVYPTYHAPAEGFGMKLSEDWNQNQVIVAKTMEDAISEAKRSNKEYCDSHALYLKQTLGLLPSDNDPATVEWEIRTVELFGLANPLAPVAVVGFDK